MRPRTSLIVNADDFGLCEAVNRGVVRAHDEGILRSASLMVRYSAAEPAVELAAKRPRLSLGLHLDLGEWIWRDGEWVPLYEVVRISDLTAVESEARAQLRAFEKLTGRSPTHLDSHQHLHRRRELSDVIYRLS